jgi:hypothetical protein
MPSSALMTWRRERGERLDALMDAHIHAGGPNQRRRWLTVRSEGATFALGTYRKWRRELDILADNFDAETAVQLGRLFGRKEPW